MFIKLTNRDDLGVIVNTTYVIGVSPYGLYEPIDEPDDKSEDKPEQRELPKFTEMGSKVQFDNEYFIHVKETTNDIWKMISEKANDQIHM